MGVLKPSEGIGRWVLQASYDSVPWNVTQCFSASSLTAATAFIQAMKDSWNTNLKASTTTAVTLVRCEGLWNDDPMLHAIDIPANIVGTGGTGVLPSNCALLVKRLTDFAGRAFRGRMYWPGMLASGNVDPAGAITGSVVTALQTHFDALFADLDAVGSSFPAILHAAALEATPVTKFVVESEIGTQRRRMRGT